jgi:hypothetical protein
MTDVSITETVTDVTVSDTEISVDITETPIDVTVAVSVPEGASRQVWAGSAFSGASDDTDRYIVHTESISDNALISMGLRILLPSEYTLSTVTNVNDKLTINKPLSDDDTVVLWNF